MWVEGQFCLPWDICHYLEIFLLVTIGEEVLLASSVKDSDVAQHPTIHRTACLPPKKTQSKCHSPKAETF